MNKSARVIMEAALEKMGINTYFMSDTNIRFLYLRLKEYEHNEVPYSIREIDDFDTALKSNNLTIGAGAGIRALTYEEYIKLADFKLQNPTTYELLNDTML